MQFERIYSLIGVVLVLIGIVCIALVLKRSRQQRERYATYGARYRQDKEFSIFDEDTEPSHTYNTTPSSTAPKIRQYPAPLTVTPEEMPAELPRTLCFYVKAKMHEKFFGYDLLQAILNQGFVHGSRDFFHYSTLQGHTLISLTNAEAPGTFNLDQMGGFTTTGLCLFIQPCRLQKPFGAFDLMVNKAKQLAEELGGIVEDEHHHLLTAERLNDWRSRLVE